MRRLPLPVLIVLGAFASGPACVNRLASSSISTDDGISGRAFSDTEFLEPHVDSPDLDASTWRTFNGFDFVLQRGSDAAWLAASFYSDSDDEYVPWVRRYGAGGEGWSSTGNDFRMLSRDGSGSLGFARFASNAEGGLLAAFLPEDGSGASGLLTVSYDGSWAGPRAKFDAGDSWLPYEASQARGAELPLSLTLFDGEIGFLSWQVDSDAFLRAGLWSRTDLDGLAAEGVASRTAAAEGSSTSHRTVEDGTGRVCLFSEDDDYTADSGATTFRAVQQHCLEDPRLLTEESFAPDPAAAFSPAMDGATDATVSALVFAGDDFDGDGIQDLPQNTAGFDVATDGDGTMLAVFQQFDLATGKWLLKSRKAADGIWDDLIQSVDDDPPPDYDGTSALSSPANRPPLPAVAHLEDSRFLAVWAGYDGASEIEVLFASIYDAEGDVWARADLLPFEASMDSDFLDAAGSEYHSVESIQLFSNGEGQALLAVRYVSSNPRGTDADDGDDLVRKIALARFSGITDAWTDFAYRGRPGHEDDEAVGCWPSEADDPPTQPTIGDPTGAGVQAQACLHPGRGVVFEDGSAVYVFGMQDNDMRYRIGAVRFE